ncbi:prepilin peptidase [Carboxydothermus ferrireducens]|uniref:prepilin peptidase n=1 Tax=Carboxydothermus ferrireducens TaxID=54265 RepID=UPI001FE06F39|nr:A24 family peptidase [Carboxydothermus ferrireducens]
MISLLKLLFTFTAGSLAGSYANALAYRALNGINPAISSHCPVCGKKLGFWEQIPVASYLVQKGRCRGCGTKIPAKYLLAEIAGGIAGVAGFLKFGMSFEWMFWLVFVAYLTALSITDIEEMLLPNTIVLRFFAFGLIYAAVKGNLFPALWGSLLAGLPFLIVYLVKPSSLGGGDVKLAAVLGFWLGIEAVQAVFMGLTFFIFYALIRGIIRGSFKTVLPLGQFLALGAVITFLTGGIVWS